MCNYYLFSKDKHSLSWDGFHVIQTSNSQRLIGGKPQKLINQSKEISCIISVNHFNPGWWKHERKSFKYQKKKKKVKEKISTHKTKSLSVKKSNWLQQDETWMSAQLTKGDILALQWCWLIYGSGDQPEFTSCAHSHINAYIHTQTQWTFIKGSR